MTTTLPQTLEPLDRETLRRQGEELRQEIDEMQQEIELSRALLARVRRNKQRTAEVDAWIAQRQQA